MRNQKFITAVIVCLFSLFLLTHEARAQAAVSGYTTIDYFEETNTVDAYSETDEDYDVNSAYSAFVSLTVRDQNNSYMGGAIATDDGTYGFAAVEVQFSGSPDATYTALALHKAYANEWEYDYTFWPFVSISYYDVYNFGFFEDQGVVSPLHYSFLGNGPMATRPTRPIILGFTTDQATVQTGASPDHLVVDHDDQGYTDYKCQSTYYVRQVIFQVVSQDSNGDAPVGSVVVEEIFDFVPTNSCPNQGNPKPSSCAPTTSDGKFMDSMSAGCGSQSGSSSCGYDLTWSWWWCGGNHHPIVQLASLSDQVRRNSVKLNDRLTQWPDGTPFRR